MPAARLPEDEDVRLTQLRRCEIIDTPPDPRFDALTRLASGIFATPMASVTLIDSERQWLKSRIGLSAETPRAHSFCAHTILTPEPFVIENAVVDPRFSDNPLVTGGPAIRFYAGIPIHYGAQPLGALCVLDTAPRSFGADERRRLGDLALAAEGLLGLYALSARARHGGALLQTRAHDPRAVAERVLMLAESGVPFGELAARVQDAVRAWQVAVDRGAGGPFSVFATNEDGWAALGLWTLYAHDVMKLTTARQMISVFAPPNENNTAAYIAGVERLVGTGPLDPHDFEVRKTLCKAIARWEDCHAVWPDPEINGGMLLSEAHWPGFLAAHQAGTATA